jgi:hypothetical protein
LSGYGYDFVEHSGGRLGHFAFSYEQSMRLVPVVLTLGDVLELDGWLSRYVGYYILWSSLTVNFGSLCVPIDSMDPPRSCGSHADRFMNSDGFGCQVMPILFYGAN